MEFNQTKFEEFITRLRNKNLDEEDISGSVLQINSRFGDLTLSELITVSWRLKEIETITGLSLKNSNLSADDLQSFFRILHQEVALNHINLSGPGNPLRGKVKNIIAALSNPEHLEQLYLNDLKLTAEDWIGTLHVLATTAPNLKVLSLRGNAFPTTKNFSEAKAKYLKENEITELKPLENVETLNIGSIRNFGNSVNNINDLIEFLNLFPNLRTLSIANNSLTIDQMTQLLTEVDHLENLEELYINGNAFKNNKELTKEEEASAMAKLLWQLTTLEELKRLHIWGADMNQDARQTLSEISKIFPEDLEIIYSPLTIAALQSKKRVKPSGSTNTIRSRRSSISSILKPRKKNKNSKRLNTDGPYSSRTSFGSKKEKYYKSKSVDRRDSTGSKQGNKGGNRTGTRMLNFKKTTRSKRRGSLGVLGSITRSRRGSADTDATIPRRKNILNIATRTRRSKNTDRPRSRGRSRASSLASYIMPILNKRTNKGNYNRAKIIISLFYVESTLNEKQQAVYKAIKNPLKEKLLESKFGAADNECLEQYRLENAQDLMDLLKFSVQEAMENQKLQKDSKKMVEEIVKRWKLLVEKQSRKICNHRKTSVQKPAHLKKVAPPMNVQEDENMTQVEYQNSMYIRKTENTPHVEDENPISPRRRGKKAPVKLPEDRDEKQKSSFKL